MCSETNEPETQKESCKMEDCKSKYYKSYHFEFWVPKHEFVLVECNCNEQGSKNATCNEDGICDCKSYIGGDKCDACETGYYGFPECKSIF